MKDHLRANFQSWYAKEVSKQLKTSSVKEVKVVEILGARVIFGGDSYLNSTTVLFDTINQMCSLQILWWLLSIG